jgi:hypothetical protein
MAHSIDEDGFEFKMFEGREVRSNFWNKISPHITEQLRMEDGFHKTIDGINYFVKFVNKGYVQFYIVYKNPPEKTEYEKNYDAMTRKYDLRGAPKSQSISLPNASDIDLLTNVLQFPVSLFQNYLALIIVNKKTDFPIPPMYRLIKSIGNISIFGIQKSGESVTIGDVFGTPPRKIEEPDFSDESDIVP